MNVDDSWTYFPDPNNIEHPLTSALGFAAALASEDARLLVDLTTPESANHWGDFSDAIKRYKTIPNPGMSSTAPRPDDALDVAYAKIVFDTTEPELAPAGRAKQVVALFFTLVWRPEFGRWLVHHFGEKIHPDSLPRSSPGEAPLNGWDGL